MTRSLAKSAQTSPTPAVLPLLVLAIGLAGLVGLTGCDLPTEIRPEDAPTPRNLQNDLTAALEAGDEVTRAQQLLTVGQRYFRIGAFSKAAEIFQEARSQAAVIEDLPQDKARLLAETATWLSRTYQDTEAGESLVLAQATCEEIAEPSDRAVLLAKIGAAQGKIKQTERAIAALDAAKDLIGDDGEPEDRIPALRSIGEGYAHAGAIYVETSREFYQKAIDEAKDMEPDKAADQLAEIAASQLLVRGLEEARSTYDEALAMTRDIGSLEIQTYTLGRMAVARSRARLPDAQALMKEAEDQAYNVPGAERQNVLDFLVTQRRLMR